MVSRALVPNIEPTIVSFPQGIIPNLCWHIVPGVHCCIHQSFSLLLSLVVNISLIDEANVWFPWRTFSIAVV